MENNVDKIIKSLILFYCYFEKLMYRGLIIIMLLMSVFHAYVFFISGYNFNNLILSIIYALLLILINIDLPKKGGNEVTLYSFEHKDKIYSLTKRI